MTRTRIDEEAIAGVLLNSHAAQAAERGSPVWLEWRRGPDGGPQAREVTDGAGLLGRLVPADWDGAALVGTGRVRILEEAHEPPAALVPALAGGLVLCCVVSRRGRTGWRMRLPDGSFYEQTPEEGLMLDILRRSLGLDTPPPPASPAAVEVASWLGAVALSGEQARRRLSWEEALALHPAASGLEPVGATAMEMEAAIAAATPIMQWDRLRRLVAEGFELAGAPPPALAGWMDAGMFCRSVLDRVPPLGDLLALVRPYLEPVGHRRLTHLARSLDDRTHVR